MMLQVAEYGVYLHIPSLAVAWHRLTAAIIGS